PLTLAKALGSRPKADRLLSQYWKTTVTWARTTSSPGSTGVGAAAAAPNAAVGATTGCGGVAPASVTDTTSVMVAPIDAAIACALRVALVTAAASAAWRSSS